MAQKRMKWFGIATLACAASLCAGFGAANVTANAAEALDDFAITATAVRTEDPSGLRFKVDCPVDQAEVTNAYTVVSLTTADGEEYTTNVPATVWRTEGDGWNTVLLEIPESDYVTEVTAQAFVTVDGVEYATEAQTSSIAKTALDAYNGGVATMGQVGQYIQFEEETTETYTFANYPSGTQYAKNEEHKLDDYVTMYTTECHLNGELRMYASSSHNGYAILKCEGVMTSIVVNAGKNADTVVISGSNDDGATWNTIQEVATTSTYTDYTVSFGDNRYQQVKVDVKGSNAVWFGSMKVSYQALPVEDSVKAQKVADRVAAGLEFTATVTEAGKVLNLPTSDEATVVWTMSANEYATLSGNVLTINKLPAAGSDSAKITLSATVSATVGAATATASRNDFTVTVQPEGDSVDVFPQIGKAYYMSARDTKTYANSYVTGYHSNGYLTVGAKSSAITVTFEAVSGTTDQYYIKLSTGKYIESQTSGNKIKATATTPNAACKWKVTVAANGNVTVTNVSYSNYSLQYNSNSGQERISRYSTTQKPIAFELA